MALAAGVYQKIDAHAPGVLYEPPVPVPSLEVCLYWSHAHEWFRNQLTAVARDT